MQLNFYPGIDIDKLREANPHLVISGGTHPYVVLVAAPAKRAKKVVCCPCCDAVTTAANARKTWYKIPHRRIRLCPNCAK